MSRRYVAIVTQESDGTLELMTQTGQGHWISREIPVEALKALEESREEVKKDSKRSAG
jgi:hypothetical protein